MNNISVAEETLTQSAEAIEIDARIKYPCYKSFDEFIDVEKLQSLDQYLSERLNRRIEAENDSYFLNYHRLNAMTPEKPGAREVWLSRTSANVPFDYFDLDKTELWHRTDEAVEFSLLMDFIDTLPFKATGRMLIIYDNTETLVPAHRDHLKTNVCHEFIWLRTNFKKPFYVLNHQTNEKKYVESYSAWFDPVNQFHGTEAVEGLSFSIRVDGRFTDEFKAQIPTPKFNLSSTPALWACI